MLEATDRLRAGLEALPQLEIIGEPCMNILAFATKRNKPDIYAIGDYLENQGWVVSHQFRRVR